MFEFKKKYDRFPYDGYHHEKIFHKISSQKSLM